MLSFEAIAKGLLTKLHSLQRYEDDPELALENGISTPFHAASRLASSFVGSLGAIDQQANDFNVSPNFFSLSA